jgi:ATP-dependent Clp protease ATP-binding subunit ClpA
MREGNRINGTGEGNTMFSKALEVTLNSAFSRARAKRHEFMTVEHMFYELLDNPESLEVLVACSANIERLRAGVGIFIDETTPLLPMGSDKDIQPTLGFQRVLQRAIFQVQSSGQAEVSGANVLAAIYGEQESQAVYFLSQEKVSRLDVINYISHGISKIQHLGGATHLEHSVDMSMGGESGFQESLLERYTVNLNEQALLGKIDPLIGRQDEIDRTVQVLCRRRKNNPLFVGEAGVGKTAIAEGLAARIVSKKVPDPMLNAVVYSLDLGVLLAGTKYRGDFEKRFKSVLKELKAIPGVIVFIDEIHTIIGAGAASGGTMDASNLLKPLLSSGELRCMGSTTFQEYRTIFEKDRALTRRFQKIDINEPSVEETYQILQGLKTRFEEYHGVKYTKEALRAAAELSERYINERQLPDKAIDVVDEAGAFQRLQPAHKRKRTIGRREIEEMVALIARIPSRNMSASDKEVLQNLDRDLRMLVFGQDHAISSLSTAIKLSRSGLRDPQKPVGAFLFAGPTGVGKTEVTRQLAVTLGVELIRFDMSEYMERHSVSRLIGSPPGYVGFEEGGLLTEAINKHPHAVLLLDEIEKAHPDIYNILLQVMDHGTLTDNNGRIADFRHVILVMTTNAGADVLEHTSMGFVESDAHLDSGDAVRRLFAPEFRNRLDAVIQFSHLEQNVLHRVVDKFLTELEVQLTAKDVVMEVDSAARDWLAVHGYDRKMGARPMARLIQEHIKKPLADELIFGRLTEGGNVVISVENDKIVYKIKEVASRTSLSAQKQT